MDCLFKSLLEVFVFGASEHQSNRRSLQTEFVGQMFLHVPYISFISHRQVIHENTEGWRSCFYLDNKHYLEFSDHCSRHLLYFLEFSKPYVEHSCRYSSVPAEVGFVNCFENIFHSNLIGSTNKLQNLRINPSHKLLNLFHHELCSFFFPLLINKIPFVDNEYDSSAFFDGKIY